MKFTKKMFQDVLEMQNECNAVAVSGNLAANWIEAIESRGGVVEYAYGNALIVELGEFLTEVGYKWWKKTDSHRDKAQMELIDVFHFLLSMMLIDGKGKSAEEIAELAERIIQHLDYYHNSLSKSLTTKQVCSVCVSRMAACAGAWQEEQEYARKPNTATLHKLLIYFFVAAEEIGLSGEDLYRSYVGKNILNVFRYENGFKDGSYLKTWFSTDDFKGVEDNEVLQCVLDNLKPENTTKEFIKSVLTTIYRSIFTGEFHKNSDEVFQFVTNTVNTEQFKND